jgi:hypothetical protein
MKPSGVGKSKMKTGNYFITPKQIREGRWLASVLNSCIKRGDSPEGYITFFKCGCGCGPNPFIIKTKGT